MSDGLGGLLLRGAVLGLSIAAPVGPIGVLCIRRTLAEGRTHGLVSGLGAASADLFYGCVAAMGLSALGNSLLAQLRWVQLAGGLFLLFLGVRTLLSVPAERAAEAKASGLWGAYASTLLLTLTNPMTILLFTGAFAGMGIAETAGGYTRAGAFVLGVFVGSASWWLALSAAVSVLRARFSLRAMRWVNVVSGVIIIALGLYALGQLVLH
ncbi:MAG: LysE family transporter [Chloroflexi bacterium]|nr:LysE family transporter [Chloroflexota bacterium]